MRELLDDLLDFSRTSQGLGIPVHLESCSLASACREEIEQRRAAHPNADFEFECDIEGEGMWDPSRIKQALGNLIANAVQYGAAGGRVVVRLGKADSMVHLSVANSGPAIPSAMLTAIFEPYRRGQHDARADRTNLGLGLFIVKEVVRAHGGTVEVQSDGNATVFAMNLPTAAH
jgi:signal transduction histidine kinase